MTSINQNYDGGIETGASGNDFYAALVPFGSFAAVTETERYHPLPANWMIGLADVVQIDYDGRLASGGPPISIATSSSSRRAAT